MPDAEDERPAVAALACHEQRAEPEHRGEQHERQRERHPTGERLRPQQRRDRDDRRDEADPQGGLAAASRTSPDVFRRQVDRTVRHEDGQRHDAEEQRERVEQAEQVAGVVERTRRRTAKSVSAGVPASGSIAMPLTMLPNATPNSRAGSAEPDDDGPVPAGPPRGRVPLAAVLEGDAAQDEADQDEEQREVHAAEHRRVPEREGREGRAAGDEQPHLVAVPHGRDRVDHHAATQVVLADDRQQHADAEVEAVEDEVADPEHGDQGEPDGCQIHGVSFFHSRTA